MTNMRELLGRTSLKAIGTFLLSCEDLEERLAGEDVPAENLMEGRYDDVKIALHRIRAQESSEVETAVRELAEAAETVGFYAGLRAGARLVMALTDGSELMC